MAANSYQVGRADHAFAAGAVAQVLAGAGGFIGYLIQITGGKVASTVDVSVTLDGANYLVLYNNIATIDAGGNAILQFTLGAPARGVRIDFDNAGGGAGRIWASMYDNPHVLSRG